MDLTDNSKEYIDDRIESRYESGIQSINNIILDKFERIEKQIPEVVGQMIDVKINGKLVGLKEQINQQNIVLAAQNETLAELKELLEDKKFILNIWTFVKFLGGIAVAIGSGLLVFKQLK